MLKRHQKNFQKKSICQKTQNFMLISKLLKKLQKIDSQKVNDKNVMEKCTFSTFTHAHPYLHCSSPFSQKNSKSLHSNVHA